MSRPTSASGVAEVSAPLRRGVSPGAEVASSDGQLRHAQRAARASVAEEASPLCMPLCAQFQLAEFGGVSEAVSDWAILAVHLGPPLSLLSRISERSSP